MRAFYLMMSFFLVVVAIAACEPLFVFVFGFYLVVGVDMISKGY